MSTTSVQSTTGATTTVTESTAPTSSTSSTPAVSLPTTTPTACSTLEGVSAADRDSLLVVSVCPKVDGDVSDVPGTSGATCMYLQPVGRPVELTLQSEIQIISLRISFSGDVPAGTEFYVFLDNALGQLVTVTEKVAGSGSVYKEFDLAAPARATKVTIDAPFALCHVQLNQ